MEAKASAKYVRISPRKARRVVDLIRGTHVLEARRRLQFSPLGASRTVAKVLNSAVANAEQRPGIIEENLVVKRGWVDEGPTLKRYRPRAYGRATQIRKRTSHITLVVENIREEPTVGA
jgi:large subunit ribosomal protein L22